MKNVHLIEANKPSRLKKDNSGKLILLDNGLDFPSYTPMNIYITSYAEIKEGVNQWYLDKFLNKPKNSSGSQYGEKQDVIILTNDRDLIRDNIEPIDDTFLQWFVNNPSCEEVEIESWETKDKWGLDYKIIIPKEELPIVNGSYGCTIQTKIQETIEEASERYANTHQDVSATLGKYLVKAVFQDGAKWQAERSDIKSNKIIEFLDNEAKLKISDTKTIERIKWYFETYFEELKKK